VLYHEVLKLDISVVVVALNEGQTMEECLTSLLAMDYKDGKFEVIVVDGGSTDGTAEITADFSNKDSRVRLITELRKGTSAARNTGFFASKYDHIAFTDADCVVPVRWLQILHDAFVEERELDEKVAAVGGVTKTDEDSSGPFVKALELSLNSSIGSFKFSTTGKSYFKRREVKDIPTLNILMDKEIVSEVGAFDESLRSEAEDAELCYKLVKNGYKLISIPESSVVHKYRSSPGQWCRNMKRYGRGRMRLMKRYPDMVNIFYILPIFLLLSIILSPVLTALSIMYLEWPIYVTLFFALPILYFPMVIAFSLFISITNKRTDLFPRIAVAYFVTHIGYSIGEIQGVFRSIEDGGLSDKVDGA